MLMYRPLSAYFYDVIPQQPALSNDGKQRMPALGDVTSPIPASIFHTFDEHNVLGMRIGKINVSTVA
jgi:hypothetical protein